MKGSTRRESVAIWARRAGIVALVCGLAYVIVVIWDREAFGRWMSEASPVPFFIAMALLPVIGVPVSPFLVVAGAAFGVLGALIGSILAIALNLFLIYAIAHSALRPRILKLFERLGYRIPNFTSGGAAAWRFAGAIKLTPALPGFAKNYILAVTAVPFAIYFWLSLAISTAFAVAWIALGGSLLAHDASHATIAAVAVVVLAVVGVMWWRRRGKVSDDRAPAGA